MPLNLNGSSVLSNNLNGNRVLIETLDSSAVFKVVSLTFDANGGSGGSSQTRIWGVEYVTQPANPTRSGYTFLGWATTNNATTPNVTFPFIAPATDTTYYAVWEMATPKTVAPQLSTQYVGTFPVSVQVRARNMDSSGAATILMDANVNPPTTNRGSIAYNAYTSWVTVTQKGVGVTVYATAQVSGKTKSNVVSIYAE